MMAEFILLALAATAVGARPVREDIVAQVRGAISRHDLSAGERAVGEYRARNGVTPEMVEALSWLGRASLAAKQWDRADGYAAETRKLALVLLRSRPLDAEPHLPLALGASIEVQAGVLAGRGERGEAIAFLNAELARWNKTSIHERIRKNLNLLDLAGKPAPPLDVRHYLAGPAPPALAALKGKPVLLFFWAHWCGDCKNEASILARLRQAYGPKGLTILAPTRLYGYAARGEETGPEQETRYIESVRERYYAELRGVPAPLGTENFQLYGASTTPTLVLIDRLGIVRMYHPGFLPEAALEDRVRAVL